MDKANKKIDTREAQIFLFKKNLENATLDETKLQGFKLLDQIKMTEGLLRKTGIGWTIHAMSHTEDEVGETAFDLLHKWRLMIAEKYAQRERLFGLEDDDDDDDDDDDEEEGTRVKQSDLTSSDEENVTHQVKRLKYSVAEESSKVFSSEDQDISSTKPKKDFLKDETRTKLQTINDNRSPESSPSPVLSNRDFSPERSPSTNPEIELPILKENVLESNSAMRCSTKSRIVTVNKQHSNETKLKDGISNMKPTMEKEKSKKCSKASKPSPTPQSNELKSARKPSTHPQSTELKSASKSSTNPQSTELKSASKSSTYPQSTELKSASKSSTNPQLTELNSTIKDVKVKNGSLTSTKQSPQPQSTESKPDIKDAKEKASETKAKEKPKPKKPAPIMAKLLRAFKGHR